MPKSIQTLRGKNNVESIWDNVVAAGGKKECVYCYGTNMYSMNKTIQKEIRVGFLPERRDEKGKQSIPVRDHSDCYNETDALISSLDSLICDNTLS